MNKERALAGCSPPLGEELGLQKQPQAQKWPARVWGTSVQPLCCHRCSPSTLQLQEMVVEQIFLLLQPLVLQGLGTAPELLARNLCSSFFF